MRRIKRIVAIIALLISAISAKAWPWLSPYVYSMNIPVKFVDPDGREVRIWYKDSNNNNMYFRFTGFHGQRSLAIPNNAFVKSVIQSYVYNCKNGGGDQFRNAVHINKVIYVDDARLYDGVNEFQNNGNKPTVYWNPDIGNRTTEGGLQSPATSLEHEMDHAVDYVKNPQQHNTRSQTYDAQYDTKEERRVITGSEAKTAKANGESTRSKHAGTPYRTITPTSTKELDSAEK